MRSKGVKDMKTFASKVLEICDNGDAIVELPDEMMEELGWKCGDILDVSIKNNLVYIKKVEDEMRN